jgi:hypothetical protein
LINDVAYILSVYGLTKFDIYNTSTIKTTDLNPDPFLTNSQQIDKILFVPHGVKKEMNWSNVQ